jgi:hypothetical protein
VASGSVLLRIPRAVFGAGTYPSIFGFRFSLGSDELHREPVFLRFAMDPYRKAPATSRAVRHVGWIDRPTAI